MLTVLGVRVLDNHGESVLSVKQLLKRIFGISGSKSDFFVGGVCACSMRSQSATTKGNNIVLLRLSDIPLPTR